MNKDEILKSSSAALWAGYTDKKQECDGLNEHIDELHDFIRRYRYRVEMRKVEPTGAIDSLLAKRPTND